jgi:hypothetical protein
VLGYDLGPNRPRTSRCFTYLPNRVRQRRSAIPAGSSES